MAEDLEAEVRELITQVAPIAAKGSTMHPAWEDIFEARAVLEGKETFFRYANREAGLRSVRDALRKVVERHASKA